MEDQDLEQLQELHDQLVGRITASATSITELIAHDLPSFFEREARRCFINQADFAEGLSDDAIAAIKRDAKTRAEELGAALRASLAEMTLWMGPEVPPADGKSLRPNASVWRELARVPEGCAALLQAHDFPRPSAEDLEDAADEESLGDGDGGYGVRYRPPAYFIKGDYLPGLIERYWAQLAELHGTREELEAARQAQRRAALEQRWDAVE